MRPPRQPLSERCDRIAAFTIIELLIATTIFSLMLAVVFSLVGQTSLIWRKSVNQIEAFQDARVAFDLITQNLSQATLNTYIDYDVPNAPTTYLRQSDLKFICAPSGSNNFPGEPGTGLAMFFQAPLGHTEKDGYRGMVELLSGCGYYVAFTSGTESRPAFVSLNPSYRYRLMQVVVPTENNSVFYDKDGWVTNAVNTAQPLPIAENVILLLVRPQDPSLTKDEADKLGSSVAPPDLTSNYSYDSSFTAVGTQSLTCNQLPPIIQVTMVAIAETSAKLLENGDSKPPVIAAALAGKFTDPSKYNDDLDALEKALSSARPPIDYRVFSYAVPIRESRWTK